MRPFPFRPRPWSIALALLLAAASATSAQAQLVLRGGRVFDGVRDELRPNRGLVIAGGKLLEVDVDLAGRDLTGATLVELSDDETILPGLFDLHAHYAVDLLGAGRVDERRGNPLVFLANGVTSTFPAGEVDPEGMLELRRALARGEATGPRLHGSGPYFGRWRRGWDRDMPIAELEAEVDHWAALGVRGFKAKSIGAVHLRALIERAHLHGLTVTGHLDSGFRDTVNPRDAIRMGIDRVEHFLGGDALSPERPAYDSLVELDVASPELGEIVRLYIAHGVFFDATMTAYGYFGTREPEVFERFHDESRYFTEHVRALARARGERRVWGQFERIYHKKRETLKAFYDAGGGHLITLGTDHVSDGEFLAGFGAHRELHALVLAGIPPAEALRIGTINGARALGLGDRLGTLEPGKLADLFVVRGDPLADIRATRAVRLVVVRGRLHAAADLLAAAEGSIGPASAEEEDAWKPR